MRGFLVFLCGGFWALFVAAGYVSPECVVAGADGVALVASSDSRDGEVFVVDAAKGTLAEVRRTGLAGVSGLAVAGNGTWFVSGNGAEGLVKRLPAKGAQRSFWERLFGGDGAVIGRVGHTPMAPVLSRDESKLFICNRFDNSVSVLDAESLKELAQVDVLREPCAAVLGAEGKLLFVGNLLPLDRAAEIPKGDAAVDTQVDYVAAQVSVIDTESLAVRHVRLPNGSTSIRGMVASPDGRVVCVSHTLARYLLPTTQLARGWMNTSAVSFFDGATGAYLNSVLLDDVEMGAANPWGLAISADGALLVVAQAGTRELSVIDLPALLERLARAAKGERVTPITSSSADVPSDLSFLSGIRKRVALDGDGPRGVALVGDLAVSALFFADAVGVMDVRTTGAVPRVVRLGPEPDLMKDKGRRGEMLFNDATYCYQMWQSCASCHPDGRVDGLNWDLLNDGIGNPKQTKSMFLCDVTPPTMITGIRPDMEACVRKGIEKIMFVLRPEDEGAAMDEYIRQMKAVPSPWLKNPLLAEGKKLFVQAKCADCHPAPLYTDLKKYDMGLGVGNEEGRAFDVPTLREVWRTAPYLYDGRALTMEEVLTVCNPNDVHGETSKLSPAQIKTLAAYVLSL